MILRLGLCGILSAGVLSAAVSRIDNTPHLLQEGFGPHGEYLPNDGREYCVPTSWTMAMFWLRADRYQRAAPKFSARAALSTDLAMAGLYGTTPDGGTTPTPGGGAQPKVLTYLSLRGLGDATFRIFRKPNLDDLRKGLEENRIGVINIAWVNTTTLERTGGHDVTLVAVDVNEQGAFDPGMVVINNPMSPTTQFSETETLMGAHDWSGYLAFTGGVVSKSTKVLPVISGFSYVDPGPTGQPRSDFRSPRNLVLDAEGGSFEILASLRGSKGLVKRGAGEVVLGPRSRSTYRGRTKIEAGRLASFAANGLVCGRGDVEILGGELAIKPRRSRARLGAGVVTFQGGTLALEPRSGGRLRLVVDGALRRGRAGSLVVAPRRGLNDLGVGTFFMAENDEGAILGRDRDGSGDFLAETARFGLVRANVPVARSLAERPRWSEVAASGNQQVNAEVNVRLLRLDQANVAGAGGLRSTGDARHGVAALILNGSRIATAFLHLGADETIVYASRAGGRIDSRLTGPGALIVAGPGRLTLGGGKRGTGATTVSSATLAIESAETGVAGAVEVRADATLTGNGRVDGDVRVEGTLQPGDARGGLHVAGNVTVEPEGRLNWRLSRQSDGRTGAGRDWGFLEVGGTLIFPDGAGDFQTLSLEFPDRKRPTAKDPFWRKPRRWLIARAGRSLDASGLAIRNPRFDAGQFSLEVSGRELFLVYTPAAT